MDDIAVAPRPAGSAPRRQDYVHHADTPAQNHPDGARCQRRSSEGAGGPYVQLRRDGNLQTETLMFDIGGAGARTLQIAAAPLTGERTRPTTLSHRVVNVSSEPRTRPLHRRQPRWIKFIRQAEEDDRMVQIVSMVPPRENKIYRQGIADPKELASGFPSRPEDLFAYQGIDHRLSRSGYFNPRTKS